MPGSGCQGHSQPGDGKCKALPRLLSPGEHPDGVRMCAFPGQRWHQQGWGLSGHPMAVWGGRDHVMDRGAALGAAGNQAWFSPPPLLPQGWWWVAITHSHHGCSGSSLASPVIAPRLLSPPDAGRDRVPAPQPAAQPGSPSHPQAPRCQGELGAAPAGAEVGHSLAGDPGSQP